MTGQLDLFTWARNSAMAAALRHTERATPLRGAARRAVEVIASKFYATVTYWSAWARGVS